VPHRLVGTTVELRVTESLVEAFQANQRVACHALSHKRGHHTTIAEHMPASHRAHLEWTPGKLIEWGKRIGVNTAAVVTWQLEHRPHPEQGYRACLGLKRLARAYTPARLEAACTRALAIRSPNFRSVNSILKSGLDRQQSLLLTTTTALPDHENVRGPDYYH
jgi:transposase